jgi:2-oxoglutarate ferredoxin oxidoreductase subunit alpha
MDRLIKKWVTAREYVPASQLYQKQHASALGILFFGTSQYAAEEAMDMLKDDGLIIDGLRIKAFPFDPIAIDFLHNHKYIFIVEQNRDAQMKSLIMIELGIAAEKLISVLNYDGLPITAINIVHQITHSLKSVEKYTAV